MPTQSLTTDQPDVSTAEGVLAEVRALIVKVVGDDDLLGIDIGTDTSFNDDICLESIQFVVLAEELRGRYGADVDFVGWLAGMDLDSIIALRVHDLVELIVRSVDEAHGG